MVGYKKTINRLTEKYQFLTHRNLLTNLVLASSIHGMHK